MIVFFHVQADELFGGVDILVSNAGTNPVFGPLFDVCFLIFCYLLPHHTVVWRGTLFTVCNFFCHFLIYLFLCTVTDFSAAEKARGVKFCMRVGLLSG